MRDFLIGSSDLPEMNHGVQGQLDGRPSFLLRHRSAIRQRLKLSLTQHIALGLDHKSMAKRFRVDAISPLSRSAPMGAMHATRSKISGRE